MSRFKPTARPGSKFTTVANFFAKSSVRWILTLLLGAVIWFGVGSWSKHLTALRLERDAVEAAERAANPVPPKPLCTVVAKSEVRNPDGTVRSSSSEERKVACEPKVYEEYKMPAGLKWTLIGLGVLLVLFIAWCGGWEALFQLLFIVLSGL